MAWEGSIEGGWWKAWTNRVRFANRIQVEVGEDTRKNLQSTEQRIRCTRGWRATFCGWMEDRNGENMWRRGSCQIEELLCDRCSTFCASRVDSLPRNWMGRSSVRRSRHLIGPEETEDRGTRATLVEVDLHRFPNRATESSSIDRST